MSGALSGIRILDLTNALAGASATRMLADLGAEVIKVESPDGGDFTRDLVPFVFNAFNCNKRSVAIDLKREEGAALLRALAESSDVFVHSMRPGALAALGLGRADIAAVNPRLIYASFSAFGDTGPSSHRRGVDSVVQAESGLASMQGRVLDNLSFIDVSAGLALCQAVMAALMLRDRTGEINHVDVNLLDTALYLQAASVVEYSMSGRTLEPGTFERRFPTVGIFTAADGPFYMAAYWDRDWAAVCDIIDRADLASDARFADAASRSVARDELRALVDAELVRRPRKEWVDALEKRGILAGEAKTYPEVLGDEQVKANGALEHVSLSTGAEALIPRPPYRFRSQRPSKSDPPPVLGADTEAVLRELGVNEARLKDLHADGVVAI